MRDEKILYEYYIKTKTFLKIVMTTRHVKRKARKIEETTGEKESCEVNEDIVERYDEQDKELNKFNCNKEFVYDESYKLFSRGRAFIYNTCAFVFKVSGVYLVWILMHYTASHLYVQFCVPKTIVGFIMSPFMTATPHCQGLRWIVYNAANMINNMWIILGTWICSTLLVINQNNVNQSNV